jgi:hypothetical protein
LLSQHILQPTRNIIFQQFLQGALQARVHSRNSLANKLFDQEVVLQACLYSSNYLASKFFGQQIVSQARVYFQPWSTNYLANK